MAAIKIKRAATAGASLTYGELAIGANELYFGNSSNTPVKMSKDGHTHTKAQITDFAHTHTRSQITDFAHSHSIDNITGLQAALDGKAASSHVHTKAQITDFAHNHDDRYYTETEIDTKVAGLGTGIGTKENTINASNPLQGKIYTGTTTLASELDKKVDKVSGKGLSTNDYTTTEKNKLAGIATGAEVNVQSNWTQTSINADDYIKNKPTFKTINGQQITGSGDISISGGSGGYNPFQYWQSGKTITSADVSSPLFVMLPVGYMSYNHGSSSYNLPVTTGTGYWFTYESGKVTVRRGTLTGTIISSEYNNIVLSSSTHVLVYKLD